MLNETRGELSNTIKDFRRELADTLIALTKSSQESFEKLTVKLEDKLGTMI